MIATLNAIAPIFLIIITGYLLSVSRVVGESVWSAIEHLCFYLLFPFLIIRTLSRADLGDLPILDFMTVLIVAILGMSALLILIQALVWRRHPESGPSFTSIFQGATRFHGFVAIAIIGPLYGDDGVTLAPHVQHENNTNALDKETGDDTSSAKKEEKREMFNKNYTKKV